jgi:hypothetical protein
MGKVLLSTAFLLWSFTTATAQRKAQLNGHAVSLYASEEWNQKTDQTAASTPSRWILEVSESSPVDAGQLCAAAGISFLWSLNEGLILAQLPAGYPVASLSKKGFPFISPFSSEVRIQPDLLVRIEAEPEEEFLIQVLTFPGTRSDLLHNQWKSSWGQWIETWQGDILKVQIRANSSQIRELSDQNWVFLIEESEGELHPVNHRTAENGRIQTLQSEFYPGLKGLTGKGITLAVGDGGAVIPHVDLNGTQTNMTFTRMGSFGDHPDHVTGTIAGKGFLDIRARGMAPLANILNLTTSSVVSVGQFLRQQHGVTLTNNSYGATLNCNRAGNYNATAAFMDAQQFQLSDLLHVVSAGNQGFTTCSPFSNGYFTIAEGHPVSKNALTVGAVLSGDEDSWFSSRGPVRDGRVKPEIVVNGNNVYSTVPQDAYGIKSGTSMSAPAMTGTLALLSQRYKELYNQENPESAFLKALVCNTADDLGIPQVDFRNGFGRLNARKARLVLENGHFLSASLGSNDTWTHSLQVPAGAKSLKIMLSWTDPAAASGASRTLIHDLDLSVRNGQNERFLPWVLDGNPNRILNPAIRRRDSLNNMEQVSLPVQGGDNLLITISSGVLTQAHQKCWLVYEWQMPELVLTLPVPGQRVLTASEMQIRWDKTETNLVAVELEVSSDSLQWNYLQHLINLNQQLGAWMPTPAQPGKVWIRLKGVTTDGNSLYSRAHSVVFSGRTQLTLQTCFQSAKLNWTSVPGADAYEILRADAASGNWLPIARIQNTTYQLSGLQTGVKQVFAVRPWFNGLAGLISDGKIALPQSGTCPQSGDFGISAWLKPQSGRLQTSTEPTGPIQIEIRNYGAGNQLQTPATLFFRKNGEAIQSLNLDLNILSGQAISYTLPTGFLPLSIPGVYQIECWLKAAGDLIADNDTIRYLLRVLPNPVASLPWSQNFESLAVSWQQVQNQTGMEGLDALDFRTRNGARLSNRFFQSLNGFGQSALALDRFIQVDSTGRGEAVFTLNLASFPNQNLLFDFDWALFNQASEGNEIQVRANDQANWITIYRFDTLFFQTGIQGKVLGLNLSSFLGGMELGPSFQIRFAFVGLRSKDYIPAGGYCVDNLRLYTPNREVVVKKLISPLDGCYDATENRPVKVRIRNLRALQASEISVSYSWNGGPARTMQLAQLPAGDSADVLFPADSSLQGFGKQMVKIWVKDAQMENADTLPNVEVFHYPVVNQFPYYESFESTAGNWNAYGSRNSWTWTQPSANLSVVDTAANGTHIWKTGTLSYQANELSYLQSPCFNMSSLPGDWQLSFNQLFQLENGYDHVWLEASDDGTHWWKIGNQLSTGTNWYNHGMNTWSGLQNAWSVSSQRIYSEAVGNKNRLQFRFVLQSDNSQNLEGFGLDDVHLEKATEIETDTQFSRNGNLEEGWIAYGQFPKRVAMVENRPELGTITMEMKISEGEIRWSNSRPYLDRNYLIKPQFQPSTPVKVRLFVTDNDLKRLQTQDPLLRSFQQLGVYKYDGPNMDLELRNNALGQGVLARFIPAHEVLKVPTFGGYFLEFSVSEFSEFYISTGDLGGNEGVLPLQLISFQAKATVNGQHELNWETASERNLDRFELQYSRDGQQYQTISTRKPEAPENGGSRYQFNWKPDPSAQAFYRLLVFDKGLVTPVLQEIRVLKNELSSIWMSNPVTSEIRLQGIPEAGVRLKLTDLSGRLLFEGQSQGQSYVIPVTGLASGTYQLQVIQDFISHTYRVLKP